MAEEEEIVEPLLPEPEPQELSDPAPVLEQASEAEATPLDQEDTCSSAARSSSEEEAPPPKRVRKAREPKAKAQPKAEPKAEPKRRGRPPGARNKLSAAHELLVRAPAPVQDPLEQIMTSMRERRQAHQERQHTFFQSFLPA